MSAPPIAPPDFENVAELVSHLGVPGDRIRLRPQPGTAQIDDVLEYERLTGRLCELVDGVLVEKPMGYFESLLATILITRIGCFLDNNGNPGFLLTESGMVWVDVRQMRMADVAYVSWEHFPGRKLPRTVVLDLTPDWIIEILSRSNTKAEMDRKRREYFNGGAKLVWQVYPEKRTVEVYTSVDSFTALGEDAMLDGGIVLPDFRLSLRDWFAQAGE
jgi:Uma2 family endonuclease